MKKAPNTNRRMFSKILLAGAVMPMTISAARVSESSIESDSIGKPFKLSKISKQFMQMFNLKYPIVQAPAGGVVSADFVISVANAGCLGGMPLSWSGESGAAASVTKIKDNTSGSFFVNFVLNFEAVALKAALEAGAKIVQFSWGMPSIEQVSLIKSFGAAMGIQVTSQGSARNAIKLGADYLVCQGTEAGGHVHASRTLAAALVEVLPVAKNIPVIASGGIADGSTIRKYLAMGAAGVVMGTRFVATKECAAHDDYKTALVKAKNEDTVFTTCMNKGWDNGTHRIIRNSTYKTWENAGCPKAGNRPGENDQVAQYNENTPIVRYGIDSPGSRITGDIEALANYAGQGVENIKDIPSVANMVDGIWQEVNSRRS